MVHELVHVAHMRVFDLLHTRLLPRYKDDNSDLHAFLEIDVKERIEEFVEHMALGIVDAMSPEATLSEVEYMKRHDITRLKGRGGSFHD